MKKIKIGMIGLGDHALQSHLAILKNIPEVELIGAFDPDTKAFERAEKEYGVALVSFTSYEDLFAVIDAAVICSPDRFHLQQLETAVRYNIHAFCEKPLCGDQNEIERLQNALSHPELVITTCHPRRFDYPYVQVKKFVDDNNENRELGKLIGIALDFSYHQPSSDKAGLHGGSLLQDHANHEIDYVNFLCGLSSFTAYKLCDMVDRYEIAGFRNDGISFHFKGTRRLNSRLFDETITLRFEKADMVIYTKNKAKSFVYYHETRCSQAFSHDETDYDFRFEEINRNFINTILQKEKNYLTPDEMLLNTKMSVCFKDEQTFRFEM